MHDRAGIELPPGFYSGAYVDSDLLIMEQGQIEFVKALERAKQNAGTRCRCPVIYTFDYPAEYASA